VRTILSAVAPLGLGAAPYWRRSLKHRLLRLAISWPFWYGVSVLVLCGMQDRMLYQPSTAADWSPAKPELHAHDIQLVAADGTPLHGWWCPPEGWKPADGATLYFHGNQGNLSHRGRAALPLQKLLGQAVLLIDYPGFGRSGGHVSEAGCYAAGDAAYDYVTGEQHVAPQRVLLFGGSLGGGVAVDLASRRPHRALVLISTFTSVADVAQRIYFWAPARYLVRSHFENLAKIGHCHRPVFIAHGTVDPLIPYTQGERLYEAANEPKQFFPMPDFRHDEYPIPSFYPALTEFLDRYAPLN
jgi:fermentation-respiration switch protein FrsA (DUF1100 family)